MPRILKFQVGQEETLAAEVAAVLNAGALAVIPTETVYGVVADAAREDSEELLYRAKARDRGKPLQLLAESLARVRAFGAEMMDDEIALAEAFWPGPLTLILKVNGGKNEGFRVPKHDLARRMARAAGGMLRASSANLSGYPPALTAEDAVRVLGDAVELIVDAGPVETGIASTVAGMKDGELTIFREGTISGEALREVIGRRKTGSERNV